MSKKYSQEPDDRMEAPCRCDCGNWFDLDDGCESEVHKGKVICEECHDIEVEEKEIEDEIDTMVDEMKDAYSTIKYHTARMKELKSRVESSKASNRKIKHLYLWPTVKSILSGTITFYAPCVLRI